VAIGAAGEMGSHKLAEFMHHTGAQGLAVVCLIVYLGIAKVLKCRLSLDDSV